MTNCLETRQGEICCDLSNKCWNMAVLNMSKNATYSKPHCMLKTAMFVQFVFLTDVM